MDKLNSIEGYIEESHINYMTDNHSKAKEDLANAMEELHRATCAMYMLAKRLTLTTYEQDDLGSLDGLPLLAKQLVCNHIHI